MDALVLLLSIDSDQSCMIPLRSPGILWVLVLWLIYKLTLELILAIHACINKKQPYATVAIPAGVVIYLWSVHQPVPVRHIPTSTNKHAGIEPAHLLRGVDHPCLYIATLNSSKQPEDGDTIEFYMAVTSQTVKTVRTCTVSMTGGCYEPSEPALGTLDDPKERQLRFLAWLLCFLIHLHH
jgi:hypothetical protein